ncbi:MAG: sigma-70 family RNA polymerase sigma factor [Chitinophagales bacterium]
MENSYQERMKLLEDIKQGNEQLLEKLYAQYRSEFIIWAGRRYNCSDDTSAEVYQKAFIILYYNIKDSKITEMKSSLKTYLFAIAKNVFRERFRDKHQQTTDIEEGAAVQEMDYNIDETYKKDHQKKVVAALLQRIGDPCKTVLHLFFFKSYSVEAIATTMGYKDERVVSKRKSVCLKQLREMMAKS